MSHGASAGYADVVTPINICAVYPALDPLFNAVTGHTVWGLLECTTGCEFDRLEDIRMELRDVLEMEGDETDAAFDERLHSMAKHFHEEFCKLTAAFHACTGAQLNTNYLDSDSLDCYAEVQGRYWYIYDHEILKPEVSKAIHRGLTIDRGFYAVYG